MPRNKRKKYNNRKNSNNKINSERSKANENLNSKENDLSVENVEEIDCDLNKKNENVVTSDTTTTTIITTTTTFSSDNCVDFDKKIDCDIKLCDSKNDDHIKNEDKKDQSNELINNNQSKSAVLIVKTIKYDEDHCEMKVTDDNNKKLCDNEDQQIHEIVIQSNSNENLLNRFKENYRVDSPQMNVKNEKNVIAISKSGEFMIHELSESNSIGDLNNEITSNPIISEVSDSDDHSNLLSPTFDDIKSPVMSEEEEKNLRGFLKTLNVGENKCVSPETVQNEQLIIPIINSPKCEQTNDLKMRRAKKRAEIESHFFPQIANPRYLDIIKEESGDSTDTDRKSDKHELDHDHDDDSESFIIERKSMSPKILGHNVNAVFPKSNLDFSKIMNKSLISDSPKIETKCVLVESKIIDTISADVTCSTKWSKEEFCNKNEAEMVYIDSSSSSDVMELDYTADTEDISENTPQIETPIIGGSLGSPLGNEFDNDNTADDMSDGFSRDTTPEVNNMHSNSLTRQDSSSSVCSSNHSQSTARYLNFSQMQELNNNNNCNSNNNNNSNNDNNNTSHNNNNDENQKDSVSELPLTDMVRLGAEEPSSNKTLRQLCVEKLSNMPYGGAVLEELANVSQSLSSLTNEKEMKLRTFSKKLTTPPPIPDPLDFMKSNDQNINDNDKPPTPPPPPVPDRPNFNCYFDHSNDNNHVDEKLPTPPPPPTSIAMEHPIHVHFDKNIINNNNKDDKKNNSDLNNYELKSSEKQQHENLFKKEHDEKFQEMKKSMQTMSSSISSSSSSQMKSTCENHEMKSSLDQKQQQQHQQQNEDLKKQYQHNQNNNIESVSDSILNKNIDDAKNTKNRLLAIIRDSEKQFSSENCEKSFNKSESIKKTSSENIKTTNQSSGQSTNNNNTTNSNMFNTTKHIPMTSFKTLNDNPNVKSSSYSNFESSSFESKKKLENGKLVYESTDKDLAKLKNIDGETVENSRIKETNITNPNNMNENIKRTSYFDNNNNASTTTDDIMNKNKNNKFHFTEFDFVPKNIFENFQENFKSNLSDLKSKSHQNIFFGKSNPFDEINKEFKKKFETNLFNNATNRPFSLHEKMRLNSNNFSDWMKHATSQQKMQSSEEITSSAQSTQSTQKMNSSESSENIIKPILKENDFVQNGRSFSTMEIRAPRLSKLGQSSSFDENQRSHHQSSSESYYETSSSSMSNQQQQQQQNRVLQQRKSMFDQPSSKNYEINTRRFSLPKEIQDKQLNFIKQKEKELQMEFDRLEQERRKLEKEMMEWNEAQQTNPELITEAEKFRQEFQNEWLNKVAEREERRLQKIIKISKPTNEIPKQTTSFTTNKDLGDEFLSKVRERRSKLNMPSDSDWESGAESNPTERTNTPKNERVIEVKLIEGGETVADQKRLPKHLKEFIELTQSTSSHNEQKTMSSNQTSSTQTQEGIWSPNSKSVETLNTENKLKENSSKQSQQIPVWTPRSAGPSPTLPHKEFRSVNFESPTFQRKIYTKDSKEVPPPWNSEQNYNKTTLNSQTLNQINKNTQISQSTGNLTNIGPRYTTSGLFNTTKTQNQLFNQKDSEILKGLQKPGDNIQQQQKIQLHESQALPSFNKSNENVHNIKIEQKNESEMSTIIPTAVDGIGPITKDGMPLVLRSEVPENNQSKWYKKMYNTLHKAKDDDEYVTVRYKTRRGRYPYKSSLSGYMSEPDLNVETEQGKYNTLDRRRSPSGTSQQYNEQNYGTLPTPVKSSFSQFLNTHNPGKIENYTPGHSSISDKEIQKHLETQQQKQQLQHHSSTISQGYLSKALKEQGYESDSSLLFRKKPDSTLPSLSPVEQKQLYREMQSGGEPPLQGFRKPAPEKPKESAEPPPPPLKDVTLHPFSQNNNNSEPPRRYIESDVNIHYRTPIRQEFKDDIPADELAYRQAETMKRLYQEEKQRKYLRELQDLSNRRHTDNFTPSQKSPIPLNRYDKFEADLAQTTQQSTVQLICKALYNFQGQSNRELSFRKGEVIYIRRQVDKNWYEGEHNGKIGLLPANYVEIIGKDSQSFTSSSTITKKPEGHARAKYNFNAQSAVELSLNKGEMVTLTRRVDDNWFEGKIANRKGIFPVSYVEVLQEIGASEISNKSNFENSLTNGMQSKIQSSNNTELHIDTSSEPIGYRALYKYRPQNNDELELQEGDVIYVLEKCDDGWFVGTSQRTGCFGTFPGNYVEKI